MSIGAGLATGLGLVFVFAFFVILVGIVGMFIKLLSSVGGALFGRKDSTSPQTRYIVCANRGCGHENRPTARFCALCGKPLQRPN